MQRTMNYSFFNSLADLYIELAERENRFGLCRLIAGYSWPWLSKENKKAIDVKIDGLEFQWNQTDKDWINSPKAFKEIGCIHTTQGYDLNYAGVIFGEEISFNKKTNEIEIDAKKYFDKNGKNGIRDLKYLKAYIINIYKTIMYRGIKGTFIYACDENLREYFKKHCSVYKKNFRLRILYGEDVIPYVNSVPLYDIKVAAGSFSDAQVSSDCEWVELPIKYSANKEYFVCQIIGESMNKRIANGAYCLFKKIF
jgi:DUF2075 family protein